MTASSVYSATADSVSHAKAARLYSAPRLLMAATSSSLSGVAAG